MRDEPNVAIEGPIPLSPETVEDGHQASMFLVNARPNKLDDRDVMPRLASRTETVAEYTSERFLQQLLSASIAPTCLTRRKIGRNPLPL